MQKNRKKVKKKQMKQRQARTKKKKEMKARRRDNATKWALNVKNNQQKKSKVAKNPAAKGILSTLGL